MGRYTLERAVRSSNRAYARIERARDERRFTWTDRGFRWVGANYDSAIRWTLIWGALLDRWNVQEADAIAHDAPTYR